MKSVKKRFNAGLIVRTVVSAALIGIMCLPGSTEKIALASVGMMMPQGVYRLFISSSSDKNESSGSSSEKSDKDMTHTGLIAVPDDIKALIEKYTILLKDDTKAGVITELAYTKSNATHTYNNVYVRNTTEKYQELDIEAELKKDVDLEIDDISEPTVLIFHSHTSEGYEMIERNWFSNEYNNRTTDENRNIVRVGTAIAEELEAQGIGVVHDKKVHDTNYSNSYPDSRKSIEEYLEKYPTIKVVLDIHRDAIHPSDDKKIAPTVEINGKKAAQIMIITGAEDGNVTDFPDWEYNLRFALALQQQAETDHAGLMRPVLFSPRKYNMDMTHCNVLLEMGSDVNTLDEAVYSGKLIAKSLSALLAKYD